MNHLELSISQPHILQNAASNRSQELAGSRMFTYPVTKTMMATLHLIALECQELKAFRNPLENPQKHPKPVAAPAWAWELAMYILKQL